MDNWFQLSRFDASIAELTRYSCVCIQQKFIFSAKKKGEDTNLQVFLRK